MAALPLVLGAASAGSSLLSSENSSEQIENQAQSQEYQAGEILASGRSQATSIRRQEAIVTGATKAAAAGSGVRFDTGSVLDVIEESAFNIELDALTTESDTKRQSDNLVASAASTRASAPSGISTLLGAFGGATGGYSTGLQLKG